MRQPTILVADDSKLVTHLLRRWLSAAGANVIVADDGPSAVSIGMSTPLDLALVDHVLPGMVGSEVVMTWRQADKTFPVIMISAVADEKTRTESLAIGANAYLSKPISHEELLETINFVFGVDSLDDL